MFGDCFNKNSELSYFKFPQKVLSTTKYEMKDHINNKENNAYNSNISRGKLIFIKKSAY